MVNHKILFDVNPKSKGEITMSTMINNQEKQKMFDLSKKFKDLYVAAVSDTLDKMGYVNSLVQKEIKSMFSENSFICGPATTIRGAGASVKKMVEETKKDENLQKKPLFISFLEKVEPGQVVVFGSQICDKATVIGDVLAAAFKAKGAEGAIIDGYIRDYDRVFPLKWPVFARGLHQRGGSELLTYFDVDCHLQIGGTLVRPWDIVLGDNDGVVIIPREKAEEIYKNTKKLCEKESIIINKLINNKDIMKVSEIMEKYLKQTKE